MHITFLIGNRVHIITEHNYLNFEFLTAKDGEESELVTVK